MGLMGWTHADLRFERLNARERVAVGRAVEAAADHGVRMDVGWHEAFAAVCDAVARIPLARRPLILAHAAARLAEVRDACTVLEAAGADMDAAGQITGVESVVPRS